jgi:hypothetical protein
MSSQPLTFDTVRELAKTLHGVEESTTYGAPCCKVHGKLLACIPANKAAEPASLAVSVDFDQRSALLSDAPETYYLPDHYKSHPIVLVRLTRINHEQLCDLLNAAYRFVTTHTKNKTSRHSRATN